MPVPGGIGEAPGTPITRNSWFRFIGDRRGAASLLITAVVIADMLFGEQLPHDVFELRPATLSLLGLALTVIGGLVRLWASGSLRKSRELVRVGAYSLVRHPLYLGTLSAWLGFLILSGNLLLGIQTFWLLYFAIYYPRMLFEEARLIEWSGRTTWTISSRCR